VCLTPPPASPGAILPSEQIDTDRSTLSGLRVDTNFEADGLIPGDLIAFTQSGYVEKNVGAVVRFDEAEAFFFVPHLNFASCHLCPQFLQLNLIDCRGHPFLFQTPVMQDMAHNEDVGRRQRVGEEVEFPVVPDVNIMIIGASSALSFHLSLIEPLRQSLNPPTKTA
jgi:hypothetical protein